MSALYVSVHLAAMLLASFRSSPARPVLNPPGKATRQRHWKSVQLHVQICARSGVQDLDGHLRDGGSERRIMGLFVFQDSSMRLSDTGYCTGGTDGLFAPAYYYFLKDVIIRRQPQFGQKVTLDTVLDSETVHRGRGLPTVLENRDTYCSFRQHSIWPGGYIEQYKSQEFRLTSVLV
jgi:hypothetical protein